MFKPITNRTPAAANCNININNSKIAFLYWDGWPCPG